MRTTLKAFALVAMLLMVLAGCKIELAVPDDQGTVAPVPDDTEKPSDDTETPDDEEKTADTETAGKYLAAFDDAVFLGNLHLLMKGEKAEGAASISAGAISFNEGKTELAFSLSFADYDLDGEGAGVKTVSGKASLILTGNTDKGLFSSDAYSVKDADITLKDGAEESALTELKITASEVNGAVTGAAITIAVDENGNASGIVDIDTPVFGAPEGEIEIDGIKADAADL